MENHKNIWDNIKITTYKIFSHPLLGINNSYYECIFASSHVVLSTSFNTLRDAMSSQFSMKLPILDLLQKINVSIILHMIIINKYFVILRIENIKILF
jgi:hypothetical protein